MQFYKSNAISNAVGKIFHKYVKIMQRIEVLPNALKSICRKL